MKDTLTAILIWAAVFAVGLALVLFLNWGLSGLENYNPTCNMTNGSCYP